MNRKHETIDLMSLYVRGESTRWNQFLAQCLKNKDVKKLQSVLYGLQAGMKDLADKKLNSQKIDLFFLRLQRSIENTLKQIYRKENPNPLYNPLNKGLRDQHIQDKRSKDQKFERILKEARF